MLARIIREVDTSEALYSHQRIYCWRSNPETREKLRLMTLPSSWFFKTPASLTIGIIWRSLNIFVRRCSKAASNIDEKNQALKLLLVTFDVNLVAGLDLWARNALVSPVLQYQILSLYSEAYLEACQTSMIKFLFCENNLRAKIIRKKFCSFAKKLNHESLRGFQIYLFNYMIWGDSKYTSLTTWFSWIVNITA